jgi:hypothetical protein
VQRYEFAVMPEATVTERLRDDGLATYLLDVEDGRLFVAAVIVQRRGGVNNRDVRGCQPRAALHAFEAALSEELERQQPSPPPTDDDRERWRKWGQAAMAADPERAKRWQERAAQMVRDAELWAPVYSRLRRRSMPRDRLRRLAVTAALYVAAIAAGDRAPNESVARQQGRKASLVRDDLKRARDAGLLTSSGGRGLAGGSLTQKAKKMLEGDAA